MLKQNLTISCEFFPPRTEQAMLKLRQVRQQLQILQPTFFSVTFGAGGSTQEKTFETVVEIQQQSPIAAAPHLSCINSSRDAIRQWLQAYQAQGVKHVVALRGDNLTGEENTGEFQYASELVHFIRSETGDYFHIEVAAYPEYHPQTPHALADLDYFQQKMAAGADSAITQYFYNIDAYFYFMESCAQRGINAPIIPGIMPISNYEQLMRFSNTCGAEVPRWLQKRLEALQEDKEALQDFGADVVTRLCEQLLASGAPGLHFYTLNQATLTLEIASRLGLIAKNTSH